MVGVLAVSPMPKLVSFLRKGKRSTVDSFVIAYLSLVDLPWCLLGMIMMTFLVRR